MKMQHQRRAIWLVIKMLVCLLVTLTVQRGPTLAWAAAKRPNIIFFLSDDHRWDRLGCAGHPFLKTPTMDRLAANGARFSNMFVTTSICAASRATILTGMYERTHRFTFGTPPIRTELVDTSYPALLRKAGYQTGFIGKFGVQINAAGRQQMFDYYQPIGRNPYLKKQPDGSLRHESELAGDRATEFIQANRADQPFCLSVSFNASHAEDRDQRPGIGHYPWPKAVDGLYEDIDIPAPRLSDAEIFAAHPKFMKESMNRQRFFWRWDTREKYRTNLRAYYRMITGIDGVINRVLGVLEKQGLAENTVIIFSGDNGYYEGQRGFAGKWSHYEESLRVPLIIYDPRAGAAKRGKVHQPMAVNLDIPATILEYAGVDVPQSYQGRSLVGLMAGKSPESWRSDTFCEHLMNNASIPKWEGVRGARYVYARYFQQSPVFEYLHDLEKDPDQLANLASDPAYAKALQKMRSRCDELRDQYGGAYNLEKFPSRGKGPKKPASPAKKKKSATLKKQAKKVADRKAAAVAGAISLFNGKDLTGWDGDPTRWSVRDGAITAKTTADRPLEYNIFLIWRGGTVKDFQLRMKFRIEGEDGFGNSGIQYRSKELKDLGKWVLGGYQADIDLTKKHMGILYEEKMRGIIGPRGQQVMLTAKTTGNQAVAKKNKRPKSDIQVTGTIDGVEDAMAKLEPGKWNTYVITARGRRLVHSINGQMTVQVTDKDSKQWAAEGLLGLQLHRGKPMTVQFKDITLKQFVKAPAVAPKKPNAGMGAQATPVDKIRVAKDFQVELLYSVPRDKQGSWVCITNDPRGRLIVSDQHGQLYRVTPPPLDGSAKQTKVESLTAEIGMAQGLLYAFDSLYVVVNGMRKRQSGLYRLRDTTGDDQFDEVKLLREFKGPGGEHGPHAIRLSPDGKSLYICAGNHTELPDLARSRAPQNWQLDQLLPRLWDATGHATGILAPGGWICKTDPDGKEFELIGNGFRNEYDIAFNAEGELFTYDADMEWDIGSPWYRPTRVNHVTSGSEFGWRSGTGKWPSYYLDSLPAVVDIGPGSPTGITFGTGAKFPEKYQRALFIADWSYGVIYAVHMTPDGASFRGKAEQFVSAAALQVSDMVVNPGDGAFYFTVGGRETQSGLYRVRYTGQESTAAASKQIDAGTTPRTQRRRLEGLHGRQDPNAVREVWPFLGHPDRFIRFAARVALEYQPVDSWRKRAFRETEPQTMLSTMVAMAHQGTTADIDLTLKSLAKLTWEELSRSQRLDMLRCYQLVFIRLGAPGEASGKALQERLEPWYPSSDQAANRELCQLLVYLESPQVLKKTLALLADAKTQEEQIHYALVLRNVKQGWQLDQRRAYFSWFERAAAHNGGHSFDGFLRNIRDDAIALLTGEQRKSLADILNRKPATVETPQVQRPIVKKWTVGDLLAEVVEPSAKRDLKRGRQIFSEASCFKCHRLQGEGGYVGPDLTAAGRRFNAQNFLEAVLEPSRVISDQYQATMFLMHDGQTIVGRIVNLKGKEYRVRTDQLNPGVLTPVAYENIEVMKPSSVSLMPAGLVDTYQKDEILDLVAYVRSVVNVDQQEKQSGQAPLGFGRQSKRAVSKKRLASKPNVVLIISDDQSWTDYSFMKHPVIKTPSLDQLARQSATFTRGYVPIALCRPSLATMITGLYPHQHKISGNDPAKPAGKTRQQIAQDMGYTQQRAELISHIDKHATIPRLLKPAGYLSHQSGKWWEGSFQRGGFSHGMTRGFPKPGGRHGDDGLKIGREGMKPVLDFIDMSVEEEKPFFVWYAPFLPHTPHNPPQRLLKKYQADGRPVALAKYYAMCEWFDETCGELLGYLDKKAITDNTLVIYVTDNGWIQRTPDTKAPAGWRGSFAPRSKQSPNEGGTRTPIMVRWPGKVKPANYETLVSSIDIAPTIYAACGVKAPAGLPGINLLDVCRHREANPSAADKRNVLFGECFAHDIADINRPAESLLFRWCIRDQWKLLLTYDGKIGRYAFAHPRTNKAPQLYDLLADPHENKNLAASNPAIVKELTALMQKSWDGK